MNVSDVMHQPVLTCYRGTHLAAVAELMRDSNTGSVVVLDAQSRLAGIVTDRDLVVRGFQGDDVSSRLVDDIMTPDPVYVFDDEGVTDAATRMVEHSCRRLPVLDRDGAVTGVVALDDLLLVFAQLLEMLARVIGSVHPWESFEDREADLADRQR